MGNKNPQRKRQHIYVLTCLRFGHKYLDKQRKDDGLYHSYIKRTSPDQKEYFTIISSRTRGWFADLESAKECVENNDADIHEEEFDYALIEKIADGVMFGFEVPEEHWYRWEEVPLRDGQYISCEKPKEYDRVCFFMDRIKGRTESNPNQVDDRNQ